jgi:membrane protein DedA with SNARE-associated domain
VLDSLLHFLEQSPEAYLIVLALAAGDAVLPALPSEAALITAGLLSVVGDLSLPWVILAGLTGAFVGDNASYALGRFAGRPVQRRFLDGERSRQALGWARGQLDTRGGLVVVLARYVPGGRTAATFTCGLTHYPYVRFAAFDALATSTWATYAALVGYFGGRFFEDHVWLAVLVAFGFAALVALAVEGARRLRT